MEGNQAPQHPPLPEPPPKVAIAQLWWCLLLPSLISALICLAIFKGGLDSDAEGNLLLVLASATLFLFTLWFFLICRVRFRGTSLVLMSIGYVILQITLFVTVLIGACFVAFSSNHP